MTSLPTWAQIVRASLSNLDGARREVSSVRDWLASDWTPAGSSLTDEAAEARTEVRRLLVEIKDRIDEAKGYLQRPNADQVTDIPPG